MQSQNTRRQFLAAIPGALAALPVATTAIAMTGDSPIAPLVPTIAAAASENPRLLELAAEVDAKVAAYRAAVEAKAQARARAEQLCPSVPDELVVKHAHGLWPVADYEMDIEGKTITPTSRDFWRRRIVRADLVAAALAQSVDVRTTIARALRRIKPIADRYWSARQAGIDAAGLRGADDELRGSVWNLNQATCELRNVEPRGWQGALIYARAIVAIDEAAKLGPPGYGPSSGWLSDPLARAVLAAAAAA